MDLKPSGRIDLEHRAVFIEGASRQAILMAADQDGQLSIITPWAKVAQLRDLPGRIRALSLHPSDRRLAWVDDESGSVVMQTFEGARQLEINPPQVSGGARSDNKAGFMDCHFDETGQFLWLAAPLSAGECEIQLIEAQSGSLIAKVVVEDPFGWSHLSFDDTGHTDLLTFWMAAGQDGQQVYWVKRNRHTISCTTEGQLRNTIPPVFSPRGSEFLVVNDDGALSKYDFPSLKPIGPLLTSGDEDNPFAESLCYLDDRRALAGTNEGRIFVVDTVEMGVETEVSVQDHETRLLRDYSSHVTDDRLGTDISCFQREGNILIVAYQRDRGRALAGWKDSLLLFSI